MEPGRQVFYHRHDHVPTDDMYFDSDLGSEGGNYKVTNWPLSNRTPAGWRITVKGIAITIDPAQAVANVVDLIDEAAAKVIYDGQDRYYFPMKLIYRGLVSRTETIDTTITTQAGMYVPEGDFFQFGPLQLEPDRTFNVEVSFDTAVTGLTVMLLCDVAKV